MQNIQILKSYLSLALIEVKKNIVYNNLRRVIFIQMYENDQFVGI